jgi:hypothetical protein
VSGISKESRRPAAGWGSVPGDLGRSWPVLTAVIRCDPVVRGPDVAPPWPQRSARVTPSLPFVWSRSYRAWTQVNVTRVTVRRRQCPPRMARRWHARRAGRRPASGRQTVPSFRPTAEPTSSQVQLEYQARYSTERRLQRCLRSAGRAQPVQVDARVMPNKVCSSPLLPSITEVRPLR